MWVSLRKNHDYTRKPFGAATGRFRLSKTLLRKITRQGHNGKIGHRRAKVLPTEKEARFIGEVQIRTEKTDSKGAL